jgi:hypothetical protein
MTESVRFDTCLTTVIVANIRAAQNAPINAEKIKRGPITRSSLKTQLGPPGSPESIHYLSRGRIAKPSEAAFLSPARLKGARPMGASKVHVNFDAPAILRKWPSLHNERRTECAGAYLLVEGTLNECIRESMAKPSSLRHLYEIHTAPQPPLMTAVLSGEHIVELARLRDFL